MVKVFVDEAATFVLSMVRLAVDTLKTDATPLPVSATSFDGTKSPGCETVSVPL